MAKIFIHCPECGHKIDDEGRLCPRCGNQPSIDERIAMMKRVRELKAQSKEKEGVCP